MVLETKISKPQKLQLGWVPLPLWTGNLYLACIIFNGKRSNLMSSLRFYLRAR